MKVTFVHRILKTESKTERKKNRRKGAGNPVLWGMRDPLVRLNKGKKVGKKREGWGGIGQCLTLQGADEASSAGSVATSNRLKASSGEERAFPRKKPKGKRNKDWGK